MASAYAPPNIPIQPKNGMIRTYDNHERTFTRPYSAKTVFFYKEGDEYFTGIRVPVSKNRYRTIDSLLDDLNANIDMPFGVRRLTTPMGRTAINDIDQLEHLGKYVASSSKYSRGINLSALERLKKARVQAHQSLHRENPGGQSFWVPTSPSYKQKLRMSRTLGLNVLPSRQVFFVLNGKGRFYRTLLNPLRLPNMEALLHEISEGLQVAIFRLYSMNGVRVLNVSDILNLSPPKVIACPRSERPYLGTTMLPSIDAHTNKTSKSSKSTSDTSYTTSSSTENGIEKKSFSSALKRNTRRTTGARKKLTKHLPAISKEIPKAIPLKRADDSDSGKANSISSRLTDTPKLDEESEFKFNAELEKTLREAEKLLIEEDDESAEAAQAVDSGRANSETSRSLEQEEERPSSSQIVNLIHSGRSTMSEAERKAEMIRKERLGETDEEDFIRDDDSDPVAGAGSDKEEILASDAEDVGQIVAERMVHTSDSQKEEILPSEDEAEPNKIVIRPPTARSVISQASNREVLKTPRDRPTTSADSNREEILPSDNEEEAPKRSEELVESPEEEKLEANLDDQPLPANDGNDEDEIKKQHEAATKIQAAFRGYRTRKQLAVRFLESQPEIIPSIPEETTADAPLEPVPEEEAKEEIAAETVSLGERQATPGPGREKKMTYTISITTGNRWGAETEADLYVQLFGDELTSRKFYLKQENGKTRFRQRHMDSFHVETEDLGTINQIIIGHEEEGYGAGIFIDYVLITENVIEGRQFVCYCSKWFDSGQVDGKIERTLPVAAFYYLSSVPEENVTSQGRWEFILHNGMEDGKGGTTSNLVIIGYGTTGSSMMNITNDKTMRDVPDTTLIQVDFGAIGDLLKVRFEADGAGDRPDYYLEWVELRDLDTDERIAVRVAKWLDVTGKHTKKPQAFREISVFRSGDQPLELQNYEGKVAGGDMRLLKDNSLQAQLIGEFSDSGVFPLIYNSKKKDYSFKVECVHLGRINCIKIIGNFTEQGEAVMEGFSVLQDIWDKHVGSVEVASSIMAVSAHVRESTHCPYRYVLRESKIRELEEEKPYFKVLTFTDMEGLTTRNKKHKFTSENDDWVLQMSIEGPSRITPEVSLCSGHLSHTMEYQPDSSTDVVYTYGMNGPTIGPLHKVRVGVGEMERAEHVYIKKMRLENQVTKTILRFPSVDTEFESHQAFEFSPVYPDIQPTLNILYTITMKTVASTGAFQPLFNLIGDDGESGLRKFVDDSKFDEEARHEFDVDAVNLGSLRELEVKIDGDEKSSWLVDIEVGLVDSGTRYVAGQANIPAFGQIVRLPLQQS
ncbi:unnamed protein product [Cylicocyclus nassatus]|uniref:Uncharacterized protein n=1 Tax=Cylicocyclus nassatus TaxID=53992 RepID=A0AA36M1A2_CYLNA|nr:unnamed protein product [Cylicocyclus nassatus]